MLPAARPSMAQAKNPRPRTRAEEPAEVLIENAAEETGEEVRAATEEVAPPPLMSHVAALRDAVSRLDKESVLQILRQAGESGLTLDAGIMLKFEKWLKAPLQPQPKPRPLPERAEEPAVVLIEGEAEETGEEARAATPLPYVAVAPLPPLPPFAARLWAAASRHDEESVLQILRQGAEAGLDAGIVRRVEEWLKAAPADVVMDVLEERLITGAARAVAARRRQRAVLMNPPLPKRLPRRDGGGEGSGDDQDGDRPDDQDGQAAAGSGDAERRRQRTVLMSPPLPKRLPRRDGGGEGSGDDPTSMPRSTPTSKPTSTPTSIPTRRLSADIRPGARSRSRSRGQVCGRLCEPAALGVPGGSEARHHGCSRTDSDFEADLGNPGSQFIVRSTSTPRSTPASKPTRAPASTPTSTTPTPHAGSADIRHRARGHSRGQVCGRLREDVPPALGVPGCSAEAPHHSCSRTKGGEDAHVIEDSDFEAELAWAFDEGEEFEA